IKKGLYEYLIRTEGEFRSIDEINYVVVSVDEKGRNKYDIRQEYVEKDEAERRISRHIMEHMAESKGLEDPLVSSMITPAEQFSGDVLCAARSPNNRLYLLLGDAVGHGLAAAINTLPISGTFYSMVYKGFELQTIAKELNRRIKEAMPTGCFVACGIVMIDPAESYAEVWNAGLPTFYCVDSHGHVSDTFESTQLPLGVLTADQYEVKSEIIPYRPGHQIIAFSDGLIEAENSEGEFFGIERLLGCLHNPENRLDDIRFALETFMGDESPHDDVTLALVDMPAHETSGFDIFSDHQQSEVLSSVAEADSLDWRVNFHLGVSEVRGIDLTPMILGALGQFKGVEAHNQKLFLIMAELLNNALDHGLLRLDSGLKSGPDAFEKYLSERQERLESLETGYIEITASKLRLHDESLLRITIEDTGDGFNYEKFKQELAAEQTAMHGRGIKLVQQLCRAVVYEGRGNKVTVDYDLNSLVKG
ncbi:MAG: ATP-binding SpoIIE family protein phosphatase, partial [Oceanospirillum sp.]|nr:ATP-binding SpoIIE family protein phosphatase [Oceanospirillum sp.]